MKRIKSFNELYEVYNEQYNDISFDRFIKSDDEGKEFILGEFGIEYKSQYKGSYNKMVKRIIIDGVFNPFNEKPLYAIPVSRPGLSSLFKLEHNQKLKGILSTVKMNNGIDTELTPDNIFTLDISNEIINFERHEKTKEECKNRVEREKAAQEERTRIKREQRTEYENRIRVERELREKARIEQRRLEIEPIIRKRKIENLIHFTQLDNLDSILENGICSQQSIVDKRLKALVNDSNRWDMHSDCVNISIEYPNTWLLHAYMKKHPNSRWAILLLDTELLYEQINYYAYHNASTRSIRNCLNTMTTSTDFEKMFDYSFTVYRSNGDALQFNRMSLSGLDYLPTSDQAEILVTGTISPKYIRGILFYSESEMKEFQSKHDLGNIKTNYNPVIFDNHRHRIVWEKR